MERPGNFETKKEAMERIEYEALIEVTSRYGLGDKEVDEEIKPRIAPLAYHNASHSFHVRDTARAFARLHGLSDHDVALTSMIAAAHDVIHESSSVALAETLSSEWLTERMRRDGFSAEDMAIAEQAIMGTTPLTDTEGSWMGQAFILTAFNSERAGEIALCVAIADMEAVLSPHGPLSAHLLWQEHCGIPTTEDPPSLEGLALFQQQQIEFVKNFQPLYPVVEQLFGNLRTEILNHHTQMLSDLRSGNLSTWQEVILRDSSFAVRFKNRRTI